MSDESGLTTNADKVIARMVARKGFLPAVQTAMKAGGQQFRSFIVQEYYSGGRGHSGRRQKGGSTHAPIGLNVITGNLRNAWQVDMNMAGADTTVSVNLAARAWYGKVHEHYQYDGLIPQRTFVRQDWQKKGLPGIRAQIFKTLEKWFKES